MTDDKLIQLGTPNERFGGESPRGLPQEIEPERDLWSGIAARIRTGRQTASYEQHWFGWQQLAAAVVLVVVSSLTTLWIADSRQVDTDLPYETNPLVAAVLGVSSEATDIRYRTLASIDPAYSQVRANLAVDVLGGLRYLAPDTREKILENLAEIHNALDEINTALKADPNNVLLQQLLVSTYQNEMKLLSNVTRIIETVPVRTEI